MLIANFRSLIADESGATAIEYGLIAALVSVAAILALQAMGGSLQEIFSAVCQKLVDAVDAGTNGGAVTTCPTVTAPTP
jgi:pilus assembly protein Flp/PilA